MSSAAESSERQALQLEDSSAHHDAHFEPCPADEGCVHCSGGGQDGELPWSFVDGAYCISLKSRDDRWAEAAAEFHKVGLCPKIVFYRPERHPTNFSLGCWESHRAVAMHALDRGQKRVLICEDDVLFTRKIGVHGLRTIERALDKLPQDWMIFYLGHWPLKAVFIARNILRTSSACTHAYIASPRLLRWLRDHPWGTAGVEFSRLAGKCIDSAYAKLGGTFAYFPMLAIQRASRSDHFRPYKKVSRFKLKRVIFYSRYREQLLSRLMRPAEILVAASSPVFFLMDLFGRKLSPGKRSSRRA